MKIDKNLLTQLLKGHPMTDEIYETICNKEPVILRNGIKAYITGIKFDEKLEAFLMGKGNGLNFTWSLDGHCVIDNNVILDEFDIIGMYNKKEKPKFDNWNMLNSDINYICKQPCGGWFGSKGKPTKFSNFLWATSINDCYDLSIINKELFPECDWEDSLIKRPPVKLQHPF